MASLFSGLGFGSFGSRSKERRLDTRLRMEMEKAPKGPENRHAGLKSDTEKLLSSVSNEKLKAKIKEVYPIARELLKRRERLGGFKSDDAITHYERSVMLLGLADQVSQGKSGEDLITKRLKVIYPLPDEKEEFETELPLDIRWIAFRQMLMEADLLVGTVDNAKIAEVIRKRGSNREHIVNEISIETAKDSIRKLIESGRILDKDGRPFLQLPFTYEEAVQKLKETRSNFLALREKYFLGTCTEVELSDGHKERVVIVFADTDKHTISHEKKHRDFPGLSKVGFRISLNEMVTEILAREETGPAPLDSYAFELKIWAKLGERLQKALMKRYKNYTMKAAEELSVVLVERFGLSGALELSLAVPAKKADEEMLMREFGAPSTRQTARALSRPKR